MRTHSSRREQVKSEARIALMAIAVVALALLSGCTPAHTHTDGDAICDQTAHQRDALTHALIEDAGPQSRIAGAKLIQTLDRACDHSSL